MRYYTPGDRIYIFGFSRGAFTARFLARMISHVGLLSMGNEEMVPFAYTVYQNYEMGKYKAKSYMITFRRTFCRDYQPPGHSHAENEAGIKVHFLGLFDTVNSVGTLDIPWTQTFKVAKVHGTADHVRHAVAIDERRVKFKAALLAQESSPPELRREDIKEVWFPGNHGDVGGGWTAESEAAQVKLSLWQKFLNLWKDRADDTDDPVVDKRKDPFQLSDIALKWMIDEIIAIPGETLAWNETELQDFRNRFAARELKSADPAKRAIAARMHDTMAFDGGSSWGKTLFWNFMEYLPLIKRWECVPEKVGGYWTKKLDQWLRLESARIGDWSYATFPLNKGGRRDIPDGALIHHSVLERTGLFPPVLKLPYQPNNQLFVKGNESAKVKEWSLNDVLVEEKLEEEDAVLVSGKSNSKTRLVAPRPRLVFAEDQTVDKKNQQDWIYRIEGVPT
jgi:hypothetical protein